MEKSNLRSRKHVNQLSIVGSIQAYANGHTEIGYIKTVIGISRI